MIKKYITLFTFCIFSFLGISQDFKFSKVLEVESSIRALAVTPSKDIWFAGSDNKYGMTYDLGENWQIDSLKFADFDINFRAMAYSPIGMNLMSIENPGMIFRTDNDGLSWYLSYYEEGEKVFYDAMAFYDLKEGIALGDPTDNCFSVLKTYDGGKSWSKINCTDLPSLVKGEAAFAASNTNISIVGDHTWIATGGKVSRVFYSPDRGETWEIQKTPIVSGKESEGIYSIDFYDEKHGVLIGGNYKKVNYKKLNKAVTKNGGKTWKIVGEKKDPGYQSCVQFIPNSNHQKMISTGQAGVYYSSDFGKKWKKISDLKLYTIKFVDENTAFLSGNRVIYKLTF